MGSFYTQVLVKHADAAQCAEVMKRLKRPAVVIPAHNGISVVCDRESDDQDIDVLDSVALALSERLRTAAVGLLNHDDDILVFRFFEHGAFIGGLQVGLTPLSLRGSMATLRRLLNPSASLGATIATFLRPYLFQSLRHARLAEVLNLPPRSVGHGYRYITTRNFAGPFDMTGVIEV